MLHSKTTKTTTAKLKLSFNKEHVTLIFQRFHILTVRLLASTFLIKKSRQPMQRCLLPISAVLACQQNRALPCTVQFGTWVKAI